jgi:hypothetical protein
MINTVVVADDTSSLKPRLQIAATVAGINTLALLDSGAADYNSSLMTSANYMASHLLL